MKQHLAEPRSKREQYSVVVNNWRKHVNDHIEKYNYLGRVYCYRLISQRFRLSSFFHKSQDSERLRFCESRRLQLGINTVFGGFWRRAAGEVFEKVEICDGGSFSVTVADEEAVAAEDGRAAVAREPQHRQAAAAQGRRCTNNAPVSPRDSTERPLDETNTRHRGSASSSPLRHATTLPSTPHPTSLPRLSPVI